MGHEMKLALAFLCFTSFYVTVARASAFWEDFYVNFGDWMVEYPGDEIEAGNIVDLRLDNTTGSGFRSKYPFLYGHIGMKLKLVGGNSAGTVTSYYLASKFEKWCELDFEFLGNKSGEPYILQTNVFSEGKGDREQRIFLWFDPTEDYHYYGIIWNQDLIQFLVDDTVIRVFHNSKDLGIPYLDYQPMYVYSSIWNGEDWATCGGKEKTDWNLQPFAASYKDFEIDSCTVHEDHNDIHDCYEKLYSSGYGQPENRKLSQKQIQDLKRIQYNYVIYDYCTDAKRFNTTPPECARNWPQY
ncbi:xyloglucan:xyloglucosyl transferase [Marchantia polymorpha subsp. ruderalis]|uniref:Xyloglucan endotransglucosylase/hydrolase n=2 Tax=Marchantia polymorpha TaxID=3197 RepID=A0A176VKB5_MARPO|nr:hypothetical protein AXG93_2964s1200 [Marchantia polymorpha subsp. ruderalis]PTQ35322.1 hypothetical protein MARPO_0072s0065 [Marchantia polymorpha]BBN03329.1 hypothetical protein Mp_2g22660 [Marchantia polymorpha subsp. ruderalis]|eukprot:PTQ35322.1 hypothetical protein MARPO_0072s0065 [Marchantia polymorpha]